MASVLSTLDGALPQEHIGPRTDDPQRPIKTSRLHRLVQFVSDLMLFLQILAFAAAVPHLLRLKLSRVAAILEMGGRASVKQPQQDHPKKIATYVELAIRRARHVVRPGCLTRGLTRYYFFRRAGLDVTLCFGMGPRDNGFMGHCWLVKDGEPFLEAEDPRPLYFEVYRISRTGGRPALSGGFENRRFSNT